jgi:hypothetical protein
MYEVKCIDVRRAETRTAYGKINMLGGGGSTILFMRLDLEREIRWWRQGYPGHVASLVELGSEFKKSDTGA